MKGAFPFDGNGVLPLPSQGTKMLIDRFLSKRGVTPELMQDHLQDKFHEFIDAMVSQDKDKIAKLAEKRFATKIINNLEKTAKNDLKFQAGEGLLKDITKSDSRDYGDFRVNLVSDIEKSYTIDTVLIKGVSQNRDINESNYDYNLIKENEGIGMRFYLHKYF